GAYLRKLAALVREHEDELVKILMLEQGKIHALAKTEIEFSADYFDYMANAARVYSGDVMQSDNENENIIIARQPIGVAVGIIAWNFPFFLIARKMGPALVTGNTIVIKPSSDTPGLALAFAKL
ncbi:aldehyde dehydrogenase family protein, partial [Lacticaseibacillus paracasei]